MIRDSIKKEMRLSAEMHREDREMINEVVKGRYGVAESVFTEVVVFGVVLQFVFVYTDLTLNDPCKNDLPPRLCPTRAHLNSTHLLAFWYNSA